MDLVQLLTVSLGLVAIIEAGVIVARRPALAALLVLALLVGLAFDQTGSAVNFTIGETRVSVYPADAVSVVLLIGVVLRWLRRSPGFSASTIWLVLLCVVALELVRGIIAFGFQHAANDLRDQILLFTTAGYFASFRPKPDLIREVLRRWVWVGVILSGVAVAFWLQHGLGTYAASAVSTTTSTVDRALISSTSLIVAQAAIISIAARRSRSLWAWVLPLTLLLVVMLTDQRTVWAATITSIVVLALTQSRGERTVRRRARFTALAGAVAIGVIVLIGPSSVTGSLSHATTSATSQSGTLIWRLDRWDRFLKEQGQGSLADVMIGVPPGQSATAVGSAKLFAFHNFYVETEVRFGVVGLLAFLGILAWLVVGLVRARRSSKSSDDYSGLFLALVAGQMVFMIGYGLDMWQGVILGIATSIVVATHSSLASPKSTRVEARA